MKIIRLLFVTIALSIVLGIVGYCIYAAKVKILIIPVEGQLKFTDKYNPDAYLCFPATYTETDGCIWGEYRIDGATQGKSRTRNRISIHPEKGLVVSKKWQSDNGFQQHVLVKDGKPLCRTACRALLHCRESGYGAVGLRMVRRQALQHPSVSPPGLADQLDCGGMTVSVMCPESCEV
jgi:hypothetical protein